MKSRLQLSSPFTKSILTLITGNAVAFVIPVLLYPVMSRVFTKADYALFGLYFSLYSFLEIASAGRYDFAVVMPENDDDGINLIAGGIIISIAYALIILLFVLLIGDWVAIWLNNPALERWLPILPLGLIAVSVSKLCNSWLIRKKAFRASSVNKATQKLAESSAQLVFGLLKSGNGLIWGDIFGRVVTALVSYFQSVRETFDSSKISMVAIRINLKRYIEFPKFGVLPAMLNTLGGMLPVFIISSYFGVEVSGSFNFSRIILSVPFALIATGISQVLMQQVTERRHQGLSIQREVFSLAKKLAALSILGITVLTFFGPELFELLFGEKWRLSGEYTSILIYSYSVSFIVSPFSMLLVVLGKIRWLSVWQTLYFFAVSALWLLKDFTIIDFLTTMVLIDIVSYGAYGLIIYRSIKDYESSLSPRP